MDTKKEEKREKGLKGLWTNGKTRLRILAGGLLLLFVIVALSIVLYDKVFPSNQGDGGPTASIRGELVPKDGAKQTPSDSEKDYQAASAYYEQRDYAMAEQLYQSALDKQESLSEPSPWEEARILNSLGLLYTSTRNHEQALECFNGAIASLEAVQTTDAQVDIAKVHSNIGAAYAEQEEYEKAREFYQEALTVLEAEAGADHPDIDSLYSRIGMAHLYEQNYEEALENLDKARAINEKAHGEKDARTADSYFNIALYYDLQDQFEESIAWYLKAYEAFLASGGADSPDTVNAMEFLQYAYEQTAPSLPFAQWLKDAEE